MASIESCSHQCRLELANCAGCSAGSRPNILAKLAADNLARNTLVPDLYVASGHSAHTSG